MWAAIAPVTRFHPVAEPELMSARLVGINCSLTFSLEKPIVLVGRHPDCDAVIQSSGKVSRRHCCVAHADTAFVLRDLGSMNGVKVNGSRVKETYLQSGDEVSIGDMQFLFEVSRAEGSKNVPPSEAAPAERQPSPNELSLEIPIAIDDDSSSGFQIPQVIGNDGGTPPDSDDYPLLPPELLPPESPMPVSPPLPRRPNR
jgi:pSer/pThr/pTyr-binding forkhead associated (FHA) protein